MDQIVEIDLGEIFAQRLLCIVVRIELGKCLDPTELIGEEAAAMRDANVEIGNGIECAAEDQVGRGHRRMIGEFENGAGAPRSWSADESERIGMDEKEKARLRHPSIYWPEVLIVQFTGGSAVRA